MWTRRKLHCIDLRSDGLIQVRLHSDLNKFGRNLEMCFSVFIVLWPPYRLSPVLGNPVQNYVNSWTPKALLALTLKGGRFVNRKYERMLKL
jgi:hypothetical protein